MIEIASTLFSARARNIFLILYDGVVYYRLCIGMRVGISKLSYATVKANENVPRSRPRPK